MPRPKRESTRLTLRLPLNLRAKLDLFLVSTIEGRVPHGDYAAFFTERVREFFEWEGLDLTPYDFPPGYFVRGPKEMIEQLKRRLENGQH